MMWPWKCKECERLKYHAKVREARIRELEGRVHRLMDIISRQIQQNIHGVTDKMKSKH